MSDVAMNYFEYQDFPKIDRSQVVITTNLELQTGSSVDQLKDGVMPYDYASFEKDEYITSSPKKLASSNALLGLVSRNVSDQNGVLEEFAKIIIELPQPISFSGITVAFLNYINHWTVLYKDTVGNIIKDSHNSHADKFPKIYFIPVLGKGVKTIELQFRGTKQPYHFFGITRIDLGQLRIFDATNLVDANITTHFDVDGSTIQYDVAELTIFTGENNSDYLFQKKQPIVYKDAEGNTLHKFYIENGENNDNATASLTAYDSISLLEEEYLGGIYGFEVDKFSVAPTITYKSLVDDILKNTSVEYEISDSIKDMLVTGFIPICTKRQALKLLCKGTNTRVFKQGGKIILKPIQESGDVIYTENQVAENPILNSKNKIGKLTVLEHKYQKDTEKVDLYNWYLQQGDNTMQMIKFDEPVYSISAYEVIGTDENGFDIIDTSTAGSTNVVFYHAPIGGGTEEGDFNICNYCIIKSANTINSDGTIRKVVIKGLKILDDVNDNTFYVPNNIDSNADYESVIVDDVTLTSVDGGIKEVAKTLFAIENQRQTEEFMIVETDRPNVGDNVSTPMIENPVNQSAIDKNGNQIDLNYNVKITEIEDNLSCVYRVVAK